MKPIFKLFSVFAYALAVLFSSCSNLNKVTVGPDGKLVDKDGNHVNPYEPGTYDHFKGEKDYPKTMKVWKDDSVLARTNAGNSHVVVSLDAQRAFLMNGEEVAMDYPVSGGKKSRPTPAGKYVILEKIVDKASNAYGKVYDAEGNLLKKAYITVLHNGVVTHHRQPYLGPSGHKKVANYNQVRETGPIKLQNHSNPARSRASETP